MANVSLGGLDTTAQKPKRRGHKRNVSGFSTSGGMDGLLTEAIEVSEPIAPVENPHAVLKRTKSMNTSDLVGGFLEPRIIRQVEDEDDIVEITNHLASRRVSISSAPGDDDYGISSIVGGDFQYSGAHSTSNNSSSSHHAENNLFGGLSEESSSYLQSMNDGDLQQKSNSHRTGQHHGHQQHHLQHEQHQHPPHYHHHLNQDQQQEQQQHHHNHQHLEPQQQRQGDIRQSFSGGKSSQRQQQQINPVLAKGSPSNDELRKHLKREVFPNTDIDGWSMAEDMNLRIVVESLGDKNWGNVAQFLRCSRTASECEARWAMCVDANLNKKGTWTSGEDERLVTLYKTKDRNWGEIAGIIPGRSAKQCRERWCYNLDPAINKTPWKPEEDSVLMSAQSSIGNKWAQIAAMLPGRTENAVKTRFKSINRAIKRMWTPEQDQLIVSLHQEHGSRWDQIAEHIPGRTKNAVKTRYRQLIKNQGNPETVPEGSPNQILQRADSSFDLNPIKGKSKASASPASKKEMAMSQLDGRTQNKPYNREGSEMFSSMGNGPSGYGFAVPESASHVPAHLRSRSMPTSGFPDMYSMGANGQPGRQQQHHLSNNSASTSSNSSSSSSSSGNIKREAFVKSEISGGDLSVKRKGNGDYFNSEGPGSDMFATLDPYSASNAGAFSHQAQQQLRPSLHQRHTSHDASMSSSYFSMGQSSTNSSRRPGRRSFQRANTAIYTHDNREMESHQNEIAMDFLRESGAAMFGDGQDASDMTEFLDLWNSET